MKARTGSVNLQHYSVSTAGRQVGARGKPDSAALTGVPRHVAIIMDGNGRWAENRGLPRLSGHREGVSAIPKVVDLLAARGVEYLTIFAFSTENWARPSTEVEGLIELLHETLQRETALFKEKNVRVFHIGNADRLSLPSAVPWSTSRTKPAAIPVSSSTWLSTTVVARKSWPPSSS